MSISFGTVILCCVLLSYASDIVSGLCMSLLYHAGGGSSVCCQSCLGPSLVSACPSCTMLVVVVVCVVSHVLGSPWSVVTVQFEESQITVNESDGTVEVCLVKEGVTSRDIMVTVIVQELVAENSLSGGHSVSIKFHYQRIVFGYPSAVG